MADGKTITVRVAAVGGDQAAAEVKKLGDAEEQATAKVTRARDAKGRFLKTGAAATQQETTATQQNTKATEDNTTATKRSTKAKQDNVVTASKVTASSGAMGRGIQNVAFQFQDMAVQAEMGVSAVRIFSQQVPQLLGGFGAIGAVAGAVVGIGVPVAAALFNAGKQAEDAAPKLDDIKEALQGYKEAAQEAADARSVEKIGEWFDALDEEEEKYAQINQELARQIALKAKLAALESGADSAAREARIAEIEADPNKSEEDKITETAAIREEEAAARVAEEKDKLQRDSATAYLTATDAAMTAGRQKKDAEEGEMRAKQLQEQANARTYLATDAGEAAGKVPGLSKDLSGLRRARAVESTQEFADLSSYDAKIKEAEDRLRESKNKAAQFKQFQTEANTAQEIAAEARTKAKQQREQATEAARQAQSTSADFIATDQAREGGIPAIERRADSERRQRATQTGASIRKIQEARRKKEQRDAEDMAVDRLEDVAGSRESGLDSSARKGGLYLRGKDGKGRGRGRGNETVQAVGKALADGTDAAELQKLGDMIREKQRENGSAMTAAMLEMIAGFQEQAGQIATIKAQIKVLRSNTKK